MAYTSAAQTSREMGSREIITGTNRQGGPLRVFQISPGGPSELLNFFPYFDRFQGPVRARPDPIRYRSFLRYALRMFRISLRNPGRPTTFRRRIAASGFSNS